MKDFRSQLLKYKFLVITLILATVSFVGLYLGETYAVLSPRLADVFRSLAAAFLTSGVVGFVFEYLTRREFSGMIQETVSTELLKMERSVWGQSRINDDLHTFWQPFVTEGAAIVIAQDEAGAEPTVRAADLSAAITLYQGLVEQFLSPTNSRKVELEFISKFRPILGELPYDRHLI